MHHRQETAVRQLADAQLTSRIVDASSDAVVITDEDYEIIYANRGAGRMFGWRMNELLGQSLDVLMPAAARDVHHRHMQGFVGRPCVVRAMKDGSEIMGCRRDGEEFPVEVSIAVQSVDGNLVYAAIIRDLSERYAQQRAISASERRYRTLFESSSALIFLLAADGRIVEANGVASRWVGFDASRASAVPIFELPMFCRGTDGSASLRGLLAQAMVDGEATGQIAALCKNGRCRTIDFRFRRMSTGDAVGDAAEVIAEGHDVTAILEDREALRRREAQLRNAQRIGGMGNWELRLQTGELTWSDQVYRIFGVEPDSFEPSYDAAFELVHPEDRGLVTASIDHALEFGKEYLLDHRIVLPDGGVRHVRAQAEVRRSPDGVPLVMEGTIRDITERKLAEQELIRARNQAEAASEAKSRFLATMSHELRTPLNAVIGFSQIMKDQMMGPLGSQVYRDYASDIHRSGEHLLDVIDMVLDAARLETGRLKLEDERFAVAPLIEETARLLETPGIAAQPRIVVDMPDTDMQLLADKRLCRQIVFNLCGNAMKFSARESEVRLVVESNDDGELVISVHDRGPGIPPQALKTITDAFVQVRETALQREQDGIGLGLYLVRSFVELHDGKLEIESHLGEGTTVQVRFPAWRVAG